MSIKKRNILSIIMVLCIVIGSMMPCFAWENIANLTTGDPWKFSSFDAGPNTRAYILKGKSKSHNQEVSAHSVYFINAVYSKANDKESNYVQDTLVLVKPNNSVTANVPSSLFTTKKYYRMLLNPYGTNTTSCRAKGTQSNLQQ